MFQNYPITTEQLLETVQTGLSSIKELAKSPPSDEEYTTRIVAALTCAASLDGRDFEAYPDRAKGNKECSYDVSWWVETEDRLELVLAVESEWRGVKYDFEKLLAAKCPLKLIITGASDTPGMRSVLEKSLRRYQHHVEGERYAWIDVQGTKEGGYLQAFECRIDAPGPNKTLAFQAVDVRCPYTFVPLNVSTA